MLQVLLRKRFPGFALDMAFEAPTPGIVALFGRSGSGKSTAVNLIAGLLAADRALIEIDGETLTDSERGVTVPPQRRRIGYVFQSARLFPHFDVLGNLRYGLKRAARQAGPDPGQGPAGQRIDFDEIVELLGLNALLARRPQGLSGGEQQRVALGRALLSQPRLLLLDEPLSSLDVSKREEVLPYLEILRDRLAIPMIYVSHQFDEVLRLANHVVLLEGGKVAAQGDVGEISLHEQLRAIVGPDAVGAIVHGEISGIDPVRGLATVCIGKNTLSVQADSMKAGAKVRVQLLARDLILAVERPRGLSVRNVLDGVVTAVEADHAGTDFVAVDVGGARVLVRITREASRELDLRPGHPVWVLVKTVSLQGHVYRERSG